MQNEPNLKMTQMNVTKALTRYYSSWTLGIRGKNEPKTNPIFSIEKDSLKALPLVIARPKAGALTKVGAGQKQIGFVLGSFFPRIPSVLLS